MAQFQAGDYLIFQLESGYGLLRVLAIDETADDPIWHLTAYNELFLDVEFAEVALANLTVSEPHLALTNRAFESTPVAKLAHQTLEENELKALEDWRKNPHREVSDRSVRLMLGLR